MLLLFTSCSKNDEPLSGENKITSFSLDINGEKYDGQVDHFSKVINIETVGLETQSTLVPEIEISEHATISPGISAGQDFKQEVKYTVTAQNGEKSVYTVKAQNTRALSNEKKILSYSFEYDGKVYEGVIDHEALTIDVETDFGVINSAFSIVVSEGASYTFSPGDYQNFHLPITYTVTAENGTSNDYVMTPSICQFYVLNYTYYSNATPLIGGYNIDLTVPNSSLVLENDTHSFQLEYFDYDVSPSTEILGVSGSFRIKFPANIVSATDYKLRYKVNNEVKAELDRDVDVLAEDVPVITSSNQDTYSPGDDMILYGENLVPGIMIDAHNGSDYVCFPPYLSVNSEKTELTFPMTINHGMFPSYHGKTEDYPTEILIYHNGRIGHSITLNFN